VDDLQPNCVVLDTSSHYVLIASWKDSINDVCSLVQHSDILKLLSLCADIAICMPKTKKPRTKAVRKCGPPL